MLILSEVKSLQSRVLPFAIYDLQSVVFKELTPFSPQPSRSESFVVLTNISSNMEFRKRPFLNNPPMGSEDWRTIRVDDFR